MPVKFSNMGTLYIVATPIGNLQDSTLRALETLEKADYIACEDTRVSKNLIKHYFKENEQNMLEKLFSYYEENELQKTPQVINLLLNGKNVALISDAGTPTISDPGFKLVRECIKIGIKVVPIPGPSSVIAALVTSGLPTDRFTFLGFLPQKKGHRLKILEKTREVQKILNSTVIVFESPHKIITTLREIRQVFGNIDITVSRELTKIHEEIKCETIDNVIESSKNHNIKGEITILFNLK